MPPTFWEMGMGKTKLEQVWGMFLHLYVFTFNVSALYFITMSTRNIYTKYPLKHTFKIKEYAASILWIRILGNMFVPLYSSNDKIKSLKY